MSKTKIEWTDKSWNPVIGCAKVSAGCKNCYAEKMAARIVAMGNKDYPAVMDGKRWNGHATFLPVRLDQPLRWREPAMVFVNSMSDLFHEDISFEQIAAIYGVMAACPQHTFQTLTKRPERRVDFFEWLDVRVKERGALVTDDRSFTSIEICALFAFRDRDLDWELYGGRSKMNSYACAEAYKKAHTTTWPLPNVWEGVSCENQAAADERIPLLLKCPAAVRFVSAEPLLGPIDFSKWINDLDQIIFGGESGKDARPCNVDWIRDGVSQCKEAGVAAYVKQLGEHVMFEECELKFESKKAANPDEWKGGLAYLRVREFPAGCKEVLDV